VRGKTVFLALVAVLTMLCATAVAFAHDGELRIPGTKDADELAGGDGNNKLYARGGDDMVDGGGGNDRLRGGRGDDSLLGGDGDDRLKGGQDEDHLDGGEGDDRINGRGDGGDPDEVVCGAGEDTVLLGRNDEVVVGAAASEDGEAVEPGADDGCEHVKYPKGKAPTEKVCAANSNGCDESDESVDGGCIARFVPHCSDPEVVKPEPDEPVEEPEPDTL
jgi:RTX calcium-binding nonapeptide repeat (4 copies)